MRSTKIQWALRGILILLASGAIALPGEASRQLGAGREPGAETLRNKFDAKFLNRVSFPLKYDGQPSPNARPEKRQKIKAVHSRYWRNFAQVEQARFQYSLHSFHNGTPTRGDWDMDAKIVLRYGQGIEVEGKDAQGRDFRMGLSREGLRQADGDTRDLSSLVLSLFGAFRACPEACGIFVDAREDVSKGDPTSTRYDVLIAATTSDLPGRDPIEADYWFNQKTGMLDAIEICDPKEQSRHGRHASIRFTYTQRDGVYIPTEIVQDFPFKGNRFVEEYRDIQVIKRIVAP